MTALNVANYFLHRDAEEEDSAGISNLKLQKLAYYAQGFHLALYGKPLFDDNIKAWVHGPVLPELYYKFKNNGNRSIAPPEDFVPSDYFNEDQLDLLDEVFVEYGQYTAWKLRDMTHEEQPWLDYESSAGIIPIKDIEEYFKTLVVADG